MNRGAALSDNQYQTDTSGYSSQTYSEFKVLPRERDMLLSALESMKMLEDDWDGAGSIRTSDLVITAAQSFIKSFPLNKKHPDSVGPDGEGDAILIWRNAGKAEVVLTIEACKLHLSYRKADGSLAVISDIPYDGQYIAREIVEKIPSRRA